MNRRIFIIANPAAGQDSFDVKGLNALFGQAGVDWDVKFTKQWGDGLQLAKEARDAGVDVVAAYGGDGTVAEVASGLVGSDVPLAILPGGTANVMSVELGIPNRFVDACALIAGDHIATRAVDVGLVDDRYFILRVSVGLEAKMVEGADRTLKDRLGNLAYGLSALRALRAQEVVRYEFDLDGKTVIEEGIACVVANSGNLGLPGLRMAPDIDVGDGLLDVVVVNNTNLATVRGLVASILGQEGIAVSPEEELPANQVRSFVHWQAREVGLRSTPAGVVQCDGEMIGETPKRIRVIPGAVKIVVPVPTLTASG
ncbi:MAG: diacylglycerol kinase family lipid kinase [Caldilineaceae bacterium]|nr:diacylglycerol kinase family lipid kinase [Caldilineaceae bacterium]